MVRKTKNRKIQPWQFLSVLLAVYDAIVVNGSYIAALWLRFDFRFSMIPTVYLDAWRHFVPIYTVLCLAVYWLFHMYKSLWEFASYDELKNIMAATAITVVGHVVGTLLLVGRMPNSYYMLGAIFQLALVGGIRFSFRFLKLLKKNRSQRDGGAGATPCLLIGAGAAGQMILRDLHHSPDSGNRVLCIIDDDENKQGRYIEGVRVVGGRDDILTAVERYGIRKILFAAPSASVADRRDILNLCRTSSDKLFPAYLATHGMTKFTMVYRVLRSTIWTLYVDSHVLTFPFFVPRSPFNTPLVRGCQAARCKPSATRNRDTKENLSLYPG